jgi:hypothetical protein
MADTISIDLSPVLRAVDSLGSELSYKIDTEVGSVKRDLTSTRKDLNDLQKAFIEYVETFERTSRVQRAEVVKNSLAAEIDRVWGHYRVVRTTSVGILQALDIGNVQDSVVQQLTEELMITTKKYWLAPAIVALAAWTRDDKEIAKVSIEAAFERDKAKTALFFSLILRRENRMESSVAWLKVYFTSLDPRSLGREFEVVLECITNGAFGTEGVTFIEEQLQEWNALLREDEDLVNEQVGRWKTAIASKADKPDMKHYKTLKDLSPDWPKLEAQLVGANGMYNFKNDIQDLSTKPSTKNPNLIELLDDILELLVSEYDAEELPLRRDLALQQAIIDSEGHMDEAKLRNETVQAGLDTNLDLLQLQSVSVMAPESIGASVATQKTAFGACRDIVRDALSGYTRAYRAKAIQKADLVFTDKHSEYAQTYGFLGAKTDTAVAPQVAERSLIDAWYRTFESYIQSVKFQPKSLAIPIVVSVVATLLLFACIWQLGIVALLIGGGVCGYLYYTKSKEAERKIAEAEAIRGLATDVSIQMYRDAVVQWTDATLAYEELDEEEDGLVKLVDTWASGKNFYKGAEDE